MIESKHSINKTCIKNRQRCNYNDKIELGLDSTVSVHSPYYSLFKFAMVCHSVCHKLFCSISWWLSAYIGILLQPPVWGKSNLEYP